MIQPFKKIVFDIETNGLLEDLIDFSSYPLKLKPEARLWCVSVRCMETDKEVMFVPSDRLNICSETPVELLTEEEKDSLEYVQQLTLRPLEDLYKAFNYADEIISHNGLKFDLVALQLFGLISYEVKYPSINGSVFKTQHSLVNNTPVEFTDTLVWSYLLYADRPTGHSLLALGGGKLDFNDFSKLTFTMLKYCSYDTKEGKKVYLNLMKEKQDLIDSLRHLGVEDDAFDKPYVLEAKLADLMIRQELHGFYYDSELSSSNKDELSLLLKERDEAVTPKLPPKPLNQTEANKVTPPKIKVKKDGNLSSHMVKFLERVGATFDPISQTYTVNGKEFGIDNEGPVIGSGPASIKDLDVIKGYLLELGWEPSEWKVRDLTIDAKKKKRSPEEMEDTIDRYVKQTYTKPYTKQRLEFLNLPEDSTPEQLKEFLLALYNKSPKRALKVRASPPLKVGTDKSLCPNLEKMAEEGNLGDGVDKDFVKNIVEYFTYNHRMNAIAGNMDEETGEYNSGFESFVRVNGTIPTIINSNSTGTSRMRHSVVKYCRLQN